MDVLFWKVTSQLTTDDLFSQSHTDGHLVC